MQRLGSSEQSFKAATLKQLSEYDAGKPLHSVVMLGHQVHDLELEYLLDYADDKEAFKAAVKKDQQLFEKDEKKDN